MAWFGINLAIIFLEADRRNWFSSLLVVIHFVGLPNCLTYSHGSGNAKRTSG
jgi:hypothetical protein